MLSNGELIRFGPRSSGLRVLKHVINLPFQHPSSIENETREASGTIDQELIE